MVTLDTMTFQPNLFRQGDKKTLDLTPLSHRHPAGHPAQAAAAEPPASVPKVCEGWARRWPRIASSTTPAWTGAPSLNRIGMATEKLMADQSVVL